MTLQEKIKKKAVWYGKLAPVFLEGAEFALNNQWISVDKDLPCNHEELLNVKYQTKEVFILKFGGFPDVDYMLKVNGKWRWFTYENTKFWMPIPEPPKIIENKIIREDIRGHCNRNCIYWNKGRCDMWDDFDMPGDVNNCDNYIENF